MSIFELKKTVKPKIVPSSFDANTNEGTFKFKSFTSSTSSAINNRTYNGKDSTNRLKHHGDQLRMSKLGSENILNNLMHSKSSRTGKIQKMQKPKRITSTNLECFNLHEKEKFRQLIEQNENYRPVKSFSGAQNPGQKNVYKHFIHSTPSVTRDDNNSEIQKSTTHLSNLPARVSAGYSRRISLSLDTKPDSMLQPNNNFFNKYAASNGSINKYSSTNGQSAPGKFSRDNQTIEIIDISNTTDILKTKTAQKRPGLFIDISDDRNDIENFQKNKKDFYSLYQTGNSVGTNYSKLNRSLNEFEKSIDDRLKSNQSVIEAVLKKSRSKLDHTLLMEEERYKLKKRQRQEKDLIERELAEKFTQQLHVDSNKYTGKYLEEDLEDLVEKDFPDLTEDQIFQINNALINNPKDEVLVSAFSISICRKDVQTLYGLNWLNDEIINFYMSLICERSKSDQSQTYLKTHAFTTFFYPKLIKDGYTMLRRWTRKIDIFSFDLILIPLHLGLHWTLAVIDFNCKEVRYYDSMNGNNGECLKALRNYLNEEHKDKKGSPYDLGDWNFLHNKNLPQQMNGSDCGMFACKYAEYLSRGKTTFNFNQSHMPYFRQRMIWEILNTKLM